MATETDEGETLENYIEEATALRDLAKESNIETAVKCLRKVRDINDKIENAAKQVRACHTALKQVVIPDAFEEAGVTSITVDGFRFTVSETMRASIKSGLKEDAFEWLRENGLEDLIQPTVNASTLSATARQLAEDGMELDQDLFSTVLIPNTSITKAG